ncbi:MAG: sulfotransferase [Proteobacteria bacterium]|jgi:hypothetical protein|nr:sulfotransferase [Pseudomonadota bacterium]MDA1301614.1 sulfotransferase [Pseudomonadota bacterium]
MKLDKLSKYRREALSQYQKGDLAAANRACARALKLAPRDFESLKLKSLLLRHASDNVTAIKVSMRAVNQTRDPVEQAALFHGIANSETELGNWEGAVLAYKRAIELDWSMASVYSLAILLSQTGNPGEAAVLFETVIKSIPSEQDRQLQLPQHAWYQLTRLVGYSISGDQAAAMLALLDAPWTTPQGASSLHFSLAEFQEQRGNYEQAFEQLKAGNHEMAGSQNDPTPLKLDLLAQYGSAFEEDFGRTHTLKEAVAGVRPIFVLGMPRSGTTLVEQILVSHSAVNSLGETTAMADAIVDAMAGRDMESITDLREQVDHAFLRTVRSAYLRRIEVAGGKTGVIVDKMPQNYEYIWAIATALPEATIVHCDRDPKSNIFSCYKTRFAVGNEFSFTLAHVRAIQQAKDELMAHWHRLFPGRIVDLSYEALVTDPGRSIRKLLNDCNLPFEPGCLAFHETRRHVRTASSSQVTRPIFSSGLNNWQPYRQPLNQELGEEFF